MYIDWIKPVFMLDKVKNIINFVYNYENKEFKVILK